MNWLNIYQSGVVVALTDFILNLGKLITLDQDNTKMRKKGNELF